jgi:hypothetical protein
VGLSEAIGLVRRALADAREAEAGQILEALGRSRIVGVIGEADAGKSETVAQALRIGRVEPLLIDLDNAPGEHHVAWLTARAIARNWFGAVDLSLLHGPLQPARVRQGRLQLERLVGVPLVDEALREWPSGALSLDEALAALDRMSEQADDVVVWIDHLEAPLLTPRHPLDVDALLWSLREISQRRPGLRLAFSCRPGAADLALDPRAAFHQSGTWLSLAAPPPPVWGRVAAGLGMDPRAAAQLATLTDGHPRTMLLALAERLGAAAVPARAPAPAEQLRELAMRDDGHAARAMQHARTLHRLGGQVLSQIARGERPYAEAQRGAASTAEIYKVLDRLRLAGLIQRPERARWRLVNPLVAIRLRGTLEEPFGDDDMAEPDPEPPPAYPAIEPVRPET